MVSSHSNPRHMSGEIYSSNCTAVVMYQPCALTLRRMGKVDMQPSIHRRGSEPEDVSQRAIGTAQVWLIATIAGLSVAWPGICIVAMHGWVGLIRFVGGDAYHYLAIARKAVISHIYTYDGVHPTNGFHPLWEYTLRAVFTVFHLQTHYAQALAAIVLAFASASVGVALGSAAVVRMTGYRFLGLLLAPGLVSILCETSSLSIWTSTDAMEGGYSVLFTGMFFYAVSYFFGISARRPFSIVTAAQWLGLILPFLVLSRLDDVFLVPGFLIAIVLFEPAFSRRLQAALWVATPTTLALLAYLIYNKLTVGAAMPLSGATKFHPSFAIYTYLTATAHFPFVTLFSSHFPYWLQSNPTQWVPTGESLYNGRFHAVQIVYPFLIAVFSATAIWRYQKRRPEFAIFFAVFLGIAFKMLYNFSMGHPWDQASWYYSFAAVSLSILGALALAKPYARLTKYRVAQVGVITLYTLLFFLASGQRYAFMEWLEPWRVDQNVLWDTHDAVRAELVNHGVQGLINCDDGITAFLLDMPMMHGMAYATDKSAKQARAAGTMLSLATSRGINGITGFGYLQTATPPTTDSDIKAFLMGNLAGGVVGPEIDQYTFSLAYYDEAIKLPFFKFTPRSTPPPNR
jgi:hypothetical protein